jgi:hypothetical protein
MDSGGVSLDNVYNCVIIGLLRHNGGALGAGRNREDATMSCPVKSHYEDCEV